MSSYPPQGLDAHVEKQFPATQAKGQDALVRPHPQLRYPWGRGFCQGLTLVPTVGGGTGGKEGLVACDGGTPMAQPQH